MVTSGWVCCGKLQQNNDDNNRRARHRHHHWPEPVRLPLSPLSHAAPAAVCWCDPPGHWWLLLLPEPVLSGDWWHPSAVSAARWSASAAPAHTGNKAARTQRWDEGTHTHTHSHTHTCTRTGQPQWQWLTATMTLTDSYIVTNIHTDWQPHWHWLTATLTSIHTDWQLHWHKHPRRLPHSNLPDQLCSCQRCRATPCSQSPAGWRICADHPSAVCTHPCHHRHKVTTQCLHTPTSS